MQNLYVYRDVVSGNTGDVFQCVNDAVMRRSCIRSLAAASPEIAHDTVVLHVGTIEFDCDNTPIIRACEPRIALNGASPEVVAARADLMHEASLYSCGGGTGEE